MFGTVHWRVKHPLIDRIKERSDAKIYEVASQNRGIIQAKIMEEALNELKK